ncbi:MAG: hypothetical protein ACLFV2_02085 [Desulfurivibrionaceae bacterium]
MKIHLLILGIALALSKIYGFALLLWYQRLTAFISEHLFLLHIGTVFLILSLILLAVFLNKTTILSTIRVLSKMLMEISLFAISLISFGSLYFAVSFNQNIWPDFIPILALPVIGVLASSFCLNIIDFNQPLSSGVVNSLVVGVFSFFIVNLIMV